MMRVFLFIAVLFILPLTQACAKNDDFIRDTLTLKTAAGQEIPFDIELAVTPGQQATGMMHRTEMADNFGMLFLFNDEAMRSFWMKNTLLPLDIIFADKYGKIKHIHHDAKPLDETHIPSLYPAYAVFEIKGGMSEKLGIKEGDIINHAFFETSPE